MTMRARNKKQLLLGLTLFFISAMMTGCGGSSTRGTVNSLQMGGAMQGNALRLTGRTSTLARTASTFVSGGFTDGTGAAARFFWPEGITTDGMNLYVCDTYNNTIRKIVIATGAVTTLAGTAGGGPFDSMGSIGAADGLGAAASFNMPEGITTDGTNLYVTDSGNDTIRKIVIATGAVTTLAGTVGSPVQPTGSVLRPILVIQ